MMIVLKNKHWPLCFCLSVQSNTGCPKMEKLTEKILTRIDIWLAEFSHRPDSRAGDPAQSLRRKNNFQTQGVLLVIEPVCTVAPAAFNFFWGQPVCLYSSLCVLS